MPSIVLTAGPPKVSLVIWATLVSWCRLGGSAWGRHQGGQMSTGAAVWVPGRLAARCEVLFHVARELLVAGHVRSLGQGKL